MDPKTRQRLIARTRKRQADLLGELARVEALLVRVEDRIAALDAQPQPEAAAGPWSEAWRARDQARAAQERTRAAAMDLRRERRALADSARRLREELAGCARQLRRMQGDPDD